MTPEQVFSISNSVAVGGWLVLAVAGRTRWAAPLVMGAIMPLLFGVAYLILLAGPWGESEGGLPGVRPVHRKLAGTRRAAPQNRPLDDSAVPGADPDVRSGGSSVVLRTTACEGPRVSGGRDAEIIIEEVPHGNPVCESTRVERV
jgi:hypothetical protein